MTSVLSVVKFVFDALVGPIRHIFDSSIKNGIFPDKLKVAKITPIFKSGKDHRLMNICAIYRYVQYTL